MELDMETTTPVLQLSHGAKDFVAGAVGGIAGVLAGQPLDTVRIRLQQKNSGFRGAWDCWRGTVAREGSKALFKGMAYPLSTVAIQNAVTFHAFGTACRWLGDSSGEPLSYSHAMIAGMAGGLMSTTVQTPVDVLKIRLQLQRTTPGMIGHQGPLGMAQSILQSSGLSGLYRGTLITLIRDTPSYGIYFALYEATRNWLDPQRADRGADRAVDLLLAGGVAGVISWLAVYPFDVIKSRMQANCVQHSPYKGWLDCARQSYREEGAQVFVRGLNAAMSRAFLVNAAIFAVYETTLKALP